MGIQVSCHQGAPSRENDIVVMIRAKGLAPHGWGDAPRDTYDWHEHSYENGAVLHLRPDRVPYR